MILSTLNAILLQNMLSGEGVVRIGIGAIAAGQKWSPVIAGQVF